MWCPAPATLCCRESGVEAANKLLHLVDREFMTIVARSQEILRENLKCSDIALCQMAH